MENYKRAVTCLIPLLFLSGTVYAATVADTYPRGTLTIEGKILDKACTWNAKDFVIQLPPVQATAFTAIGDLGPTSAPVPFQLSGCPSNASLTLGISGTLHDSAASSTRFKNLAATDAASGLSVTVKMDSISLQTITATPIAPDSNGNFNAELTAYYYAESATVTPGAFETTMTYTLSYN